VRIAYQVFQANDCRTPPFAPIRPSARPNSMVNVFSTLIQYKSEAVLHHAEVILSTSAVTDSSQPLTRQILEIFKNKPSSSSTLCARDLAARPQMQNILIQLLNQLLRKDPFTVEKPSRNIVRTRSSEFITPTSSTRTIKIPPRYRNGWQSGMQQWGLECDYPRPEFRPVQVRG
jgi:hypothetical protein